MTRLSGEPKKRIYWLDVARVIAIISISCNHAVNRTYAIYSGQLDEFLSIPTASTVFKTAAYIFSRIGVPLFLMISGSLLLKKDVKDSDGIRKFYKHNLLGLLITCEIWYVIGFFSKNIVNLINGGIPVWKFFYRLFAVMLFTNHAVDTTVASFWYLPMILCIYLLIPFFCILRDKVDKKTVFIPLAVLFFLGFVLPTGDALIHSVSTSRLEASKDAVLLPVYVIYIVAGYMISRGHLSKIKSSYVAAGFILSFLATCGCQFFIFSRKTDCHFAYDNIGILVSAVLLFELLRRGSHRLIAFRRPVEYVSRIAFGIYFVHIFIMEALVKYLPSFKSAFPRPAYFFFLEIISVAGSIIIIAITSRIPIVKKYVYMIK